MDELNKKHPERFYEKDYEKDIENNADYYKLPYDGMDDAEKELYYKFRFAEKQYLQLVNYLNNLSDPKLNGKSSPEEENEPRGIGKNEFGLANSMDTEAFELLQEKTAALIAAGNKLGGHLSENLKKEKGKGVKETPEEKELKEKQGSLLYDISLSVKRARMDASGMEMVDPEHLPSYISMHSQTTDIFIDTEKKELGKVGGQLSNRVPIRYIDENGMLRQGFFTRNTSKDRDYSKIFEPYMGKSTDPGYVKIINALKKKDTYLNVLINAKGNEIYSMDPTELSKLFSFDKKLKTGVENLSQGNRFYLQSLCAELQAKRNDVLFHEYFGIETGNNINARNTAMSDVATLLNMPEIVAKSVPMTITENGEPVHGNFMAKADGLTMDDISRLDPSLKKMDIKIDYNGVMKDCLNMMVLDYICMNMDRHQDNHVYRFEEKNGEMMLCGIQGIDNDFSFSKKVPDTEKHTKFLPPLDAIKHMTTATRDAVMKLNRNNIAAVLGNGYLSDEEVEACWSRVEKLQNRIVNNKIEIKDEFKEQDFEDYNIEKEKYENKIKDEKAYLTPMYNILVMQNFYDVKKKKEISRQLRSIDTRTESEMDEVQQAYKNNLSELTITENDPYGSLKKEYFDSLKNVNAVVKANLQKNNIQETFITLRDEKDKQVKSINRQYKKRFSDIAEKLEKKAEKEKLLNEKIRKGVANLSSRLHINSDMTFKAQKEKISKLCGKLWSPKGQDIPEYKLMYDEMKNLEKLMSYISRDKPPKTGKAENRPYSMTKDGVLTDYAENLLAEQYKRVEESVQNYGRKIYSDLTKNNVKRIIISEAVQSVCIIGREQRERKVNEINETMAACMRALAEAQEKADKAKKKYDATVKEQKNDLEIKEKKTEYDWVKRQRDEKVMLASFVGALELPGDITRDKIDKTLGVLAYAEKLEELKTKSPEAYKREMETMKADENYLDSRVDGLLENENFKKIVGNVNPFTALRVNAPKAIATEADKFGIKFFNEAAPEVKKQPSLQGP